MSNLEVIPSNTLKELSMKKVFAYIVAVVIGVFIGCLLPDYHFGDEVKMFQNDTIVRFDTIKYSKLELIGKNYRLDIPKVSTPEWVYVPSDSTTIIYRDNVRYVTLPRQKYFTETEDAQIGHSGIDSRIEELNVISR